MPSAIALCALRKGVKREAAGVARLLELTFASIASVTSIPKYSKYSK